MSTDPRSAGSVFRRIAAALVLVPLAVVIVAFAVANRQIVTVSLDPLGSEHPAASLTLPLFALVIVLLIAGVVIGGIAAWLRQGTWRRTARRLEREAGELRGQIDQLKRAASAVPVRIPDAIDPPDRLQLRPPLH